MIDAIIDKDIKALSDGELAKVAKLAELIGKAEAEQKRRLAEHDPNVVTVPVGQVKTTITAKEPCPKCGKRDAVRTSKTLYADSRLASGGGAVGTAAICECGAWFDPATGEYIDMSHASIY